MKYTSTSEGITINELPNLIFTSNKFQKNYYYNPEKNLTSWNLTEIESPIPYKLSKGWELIQSKKYQGNKYFYNTNTGVSQWFLPQTTGSLSWTGNSCFIDGVLQPLFMVPNSFTDIILTKPSTLSDPDCPVIHGLQKELIKIVNYIRYNYGDVKNVTKLRSFMKECMAKTESLWNTEFHDAGEFLTYLLSLFPNTNISTRITVTYATNDLISSTEQITDKVLTSTITDDKASVVLLLDGISLLNMNDNIITTQDLITKITDSSLEEPIKPSEGVGEGQEFMRMISTTTIIESPMIILNVTRNNPFEEDEVIEKQIIPLTQISLENGITYNLTGITVFRNGHYVAYYKYNDDWYFYNDMTSPRVTKLGKFDNIFNQTWGDDDSNPEVMTRGTIYYYTK
jgi:hypothetical protein